MPTILCVDDDPDLLELIGAMFEGDGFEVQKASSGNQAIAQINVKRPNLIVSDIRMPNGSGLDVLKFVGTLAADTRPPVVLITGYSDYSENFLSNLGAAALLLKPQDIKNLVATAKKILAVATHGSP